MVQQKEFTGGAPKTALASSITQGAGAGATFTVDSGTGYPTGADYPFVVVIGRGTETEEKLLCSARVGNTFTVQQRGYDGTVAKAHAIGDTVHHPLDSITISDMSRVAAFGQLIPFSMPGELEVRVGRGRFWTPTDMTLVQVKLGVVTPATGADIIIDVEEDGVAIASGTIQQSTYQGSGTISQSWIEQGVPLGISVTQVGSTFPGEDLTVVLRFTV